jgi:dihydrofolate reductase
VAKLTYTAIVSLDGYFEDESGGFEWAFPDAETHAFINQLESGVGTYLFGRKMYETMSVWQTMGQPGEAAASPEEVEFAEIWRAADKIVYSRTLDTVSTPRTRLEREFDPDTVARMKAESDRDLSVSGPDLARHAFAAGLVDEVILFVFPVMVGGGRPGLPEGVRMGLTCLDERRFDSGVVYLRYARRLTSRF